MNDPIHELTTLLARLPGIGERTATRLVYYILESNVDYAITLGSALSEIHRLIRRCKICGNYAIESRCIICQDSSRDGDLICVVARPSDITAIEKNHLFHGRYFVLHGLLSPLDGIGPEKLSIQPLLDQVKQGMVKEVIIATPLSVDGEATALFLAQNLNEYDVYCSRIASGLPHGGELEYTDQITLSRAFEGRRKL